MFKDHAVIHVHAGKGGDGCSSFLRDKNTTRGGPDGGDGGHGGNIILLAHEGMSTLLPLLRNPHLRSENGEGGQGKNMHGRRGENTIVHVPVGTLIHEKKSGVLLRDLKAAGDSVVVAYGGRGGWGNSHFAHALDQAPRRCNPGTDGEEKTLRLELKLIADVGLIGLPNAGKSTLIGRVSAARPRVADYPFTTLQPHPGIVELKGFRRFVMVDIPGLIEGASEGHGLGHRFLKHVERTRALVHLVELVPMDESDPAENWRKIEQELERYSPALAAKPRITVFSKADMVPDPAAAAAELAAQLDLDGAYAISGVTGHQVDRLLEDAWRLINPE